MLARFCSVWVILLSSSVTQRSTKTLIVRQTGAEIVANAVCWPCKVIQSCQPVSGQLSLRSDSLELTMTKCLCNELLPDLLEIDPPMPCPSVHPITAVRAAQHLGTEPQWAAQ